MYGRDENGVFKKLADGRVLRVDERMYNTQLTLSSSQGSPVWLEGW